MPGFLFFVDILGPSAASWACAWIADSRRSLSDVSVGVAGTGREGGRKQTLVGRARSQDISEHRRSLRDHSCCALSQFVS